MKPTLHRTSPTDEFLIDEGSYIIESWNHASDPAVSIARAQVPVGKTTKLHLLKGVHERYVIIAGSGSVHVGDLPPAQVYPGDVVVIPAGVSQKIANTGADDLVFYCICTPRFTEQCYQALE